MLLIQLNPDRYMIFRYLALRISAPAGSLTKAAAAWAPPSNFSVGAWGAKYEYVPADSAFASSNATLNAVHELARWTLDGGVLDTYTDSNSRERRPYECDGLVASANRLALQGDAMWGRHSHAWVLEVRERAGELRAAVAACSVLLFSLVLVCFPAWLTCRHSVLFSHSLTHSLTHSHARRLAGCCWR